MNQHDVEQRNHGREGDGPIEHTLKNKPVAMLAMLVHAHLVHEGRDVRRSSMHASWEAGEAHIRIVSPDASGQLERMMLPGHDGVETAVGSRIASGSIDVGFAEDFPSQRPAGTASIRDYAAALGIEPSDMGLADLPDDASARDRLLDGVAHLFARSVHSGESQDLIVIAGRRGIERAAITVHNEDGSVERYEPKIDETVGQALAKAHGRDDGRNYSPLWQEGERPSRMLQVPIPHAREAMPNDRAHQVIDEAVRDIMAGIPAEAHRQRRDIPMALRRETAGIA